MPARRAAHRACTCACQVRGFLQAALLLRLARGPAHGYALLEDMRGSETPCCCDTGLVYKTLRQFERDGLVSSAWCTGERPVRRVYRITDEGVRRLKQWADEIHSLDRMLRAFLSDHESLCVQCTEPPEGG